MDEINRIYTTDGGSNNFSNGAWLGSMMNNGGANAMWNNPFAYLIFLMFGSQWMNGNGVNGNNSFQSQLSSLQNQIQDNHNSDLTMAAISGSKDAVQQLATVLNSSVNDVQQAINTMSANLQNNCCQIKSSILEQGYQNQLGNCQQTNTMLQGFNNLQNTVSNGFTSIGYQLNTIGCEIKQNSTENTQRIIDMFNNNRNIEQQTTIQQLRDEIGRLNQTNALITALKPAATTAG